MTENWKDFLKERRKEILLLAAAGIAILASVAFFGFIYKGGGGYVPEEYIQAREEATKISQEIVNLGNEVNKSLVEIAAKSNAGDYSAALSVAKSGTVQINQIEAKAQELLGALEGMVESIEKVKPAEAVKIGKDAISVGIKLVERLIVYGNLSDELIRKIETKLGGGNVKEGDIQKLIEDINSEVRFINSLSGDYKTLIKQFDDLTKNSGQ